MIRRRINSRFLENPLCVLVHQKVSHFWVFLAPLSRMLLFDWICEKGSLLFSRVRSIESITILLYQSRVVVSLITLTFHSQWGLNLVRTTATVLESHRVTVIVAVLGYRLDYLIVAAHLHRRVKQLSESNVMEHLLHLIGVLMSSRMRNCPQRCWSVGRNYFQWRLLWTYLGRISLIQRLFVRNEFD